MREIIPFWWRRGTLRATIAQWLRRSFDSEAEKTTTAFNSTVWGPVSIKEAGNGLRMGRRSTTMGQKRQRTARRSAKDGVDISVLSTFSPCCELLSLGTWSVSLRRNWSLPPAPMKRRATMRCLRRISLALTECWSGWRCWSNHAGGSRRSMNTMRVRRKRLPFLW